MTPGSNIPVRRSVRMGANLTPMIDMTFLLVVFFVLVSRISEIEQIPMQLPEPRSPASTMPSDHLRAVVNMPADTQGALTSLRLNADEFTPTIEGITGFSDALALLLLRNPELEVTLRADRRLPYSIVSTTMNAITSAGIKAKVDGTVRLNLVILNSGVREKEVDDGVL